LKPEELKQRTGLLVHFGRNPWWRWAGRIAAAAVIAYGGVAIGKESSPGRAAVVVTAPKGEGRVGSLGLRTGLDFRAAGVPDEWDVVLSPLSFAFGNEGIGTLVAVLSNADRRLDLIAFHPDGSPAWHARDAWSDWEQTLGHEDVTLAGMKSLVTRGGPNALEETVCLTLTSGGESGLILLDPSTGIRRGMLFHRGRLRVDDPPRGEALVALPAGPGEPRMLLAVGQYREEDLSQPCALVLTPRGVPVRMFVFPTTGTNSHAGTARVTSVDWDPEHPEVTVDTSEDLIFSMLLKDGLPDVGTVVVGVGDAAAPEARSADLHALIARVRSVEPRGASGWSDR
jgi:hypothetical protein